MRRETAITRPEWRCLHAEPLPNVSPRMSNFDHVVDEGLAEAIADGAHMADYYGWDFHAYVYLAAEGLYVADVHVWGAHAGFAEADSLAGLMIAVSEVWGYD